MCLATLGVLHTRYGKGVVGQAKFVGVAGVAAR